MDIRCGPLRPVRTAARCSLASVAQMPGASGSPAPAICLPVGESTQARRSRSVVSRSSTTSGPPPAGPDVIRRRWRSTTAARSPARSPETCRTTYSVMVANATSSLTAKSGSRLRRQAETRSSGMSPSSASPAARPATPALARIRTNGSESAEFLRQARPVRTSSPPDRYRLGSLRSVVMTPRTVRSSSSSPPSSRSPSASVSSSARSRMMSPPICLECCRWKSGRSSHPAFHTNLQDEGGRQPTPSWFR